MIKEHDYEPVWGLPEKLPEGEVILWQGKPDQRAFARRALHLPGLASYFAVLIAARIASVLMAGASLPVTAMDALYFIGPSLLVIAIALVFAWAVVRATPQAKTRAIPITSSDGTMKYSASSAVTGSEAPAISTETMRAATSTPKYAARPGRCRARRAKARWSGRPCQRIASPSGSFSGRPQTGS